MNFIDQKSIVLIENKDYSLSSCFSGKVLCHEHNNSRGFSKKELDHLREQIQENRFSAYIIHVSKGNLLPSEDEIWLENLDLKMVYNSGIRLVSYVSPQNIFNSFEMEKELEGGARIKIKIFKEFMDAVAWLQEQEIFQVK